MRDINEIIVHCTATPEGKDYSVATIDKWHKARGWSGIGYHFVVHLDGTVERGRPVEKVGAHVAGRNAKTIGAVYVGGVERDGKTPKDTRTPAQKISLTNLLKELVAKYAITKISGHNEYAAKACPSFDASAAYDYLVGGKLTPAVPDGVLRRGNSGLAVAAWRAKLARAGYDIEAGDLFGQTTEMITRWFQAKRGIVIDGEVGPQTEAEMDRYLEGLTPLPKAEPQNETPKPAEPAGDTWPDLPAAIQYLKKALAFLER